MDRWMHVKVDERTAHALRELAERERRKPADQAAILLEQSLRPEPEPASTRDRQNGARP